MAIIAATSRVSDGSAHDLPALADSLAVKLVYYMKMHALSSDHVRTDITRRDRMSRELAQSGTLMKMETHPPDTIENIDGLLQIYDESLAQTAITFEEYISLLVFAIMHTDHALSYFHRMRYAFSAYLLFQEHIIEKEIHKNPQFFGIYSKVWNKRCVPKSCFFICIFLEILCSPSSG